MCRQTFNTYKIKTNQSQRKKMETGKSDFWRWKEFSTQTKKGRLCHFAQISKTPGSQMQHKQRQKDLFCDSLRVLSFSSKKHKYLNRWKENDCFYNPSYHTHTKKKYQNINCSKKKLISTKRISKQKLLSQAREFPSTLVLTLFTFQNQATSLLQPKASSPFRPWQVKTRVRKGLQQKGNGEQAWYHV